MCQNLNSAPCTDGTVAPTGGYSGTSSAFSFPTGGVGPGTTSIVNGLDLWGNESNGNSFNPQPGTHRASTSKYSDRLLKLTVQLPADLNAAFGGKQWYKIRYWVGSAPTDRTTWSVTINGAPVRLIPNP